MRETFEVTGTTVTTPSPRLVARPFAPLGSMTPPRSRLRRYVLSQHGHDRLAVDPEGLFLVVVLQVAGELVYADVLELFELGDVIISRAQHAEPVNDLVRYERGMDIADLA